MIEEERHNHDVATCKSCRSFAKHTNDGREIYIFDQFCVNEWNVTITGEGNAVVPTSDEMRWMLEIPKKRLMILL